MFDCDWSSDVCSSDLLVRALATARSRLPSWLKSAVSISSAPTPTVYDELGCCIGTPRLISTIAGTVAASVMSADSKAATSSRPSRLKSPTTSEDAERSKSPLANSVEKVIGVLALAAPADISCADSSVPPNNSIVNKIRWDKQRTFAFMDILRKNLMNVVRRALQGLPWMVRCLE